MSKILSIEDINIAKISGKAKTELASIGNIILTIPDIIPDAISLPTNAETNLGWTFLSAQITGITLPITLSFSKSTEDFELGHLVSSTSGLSSGWSVFDSVATIGFSNELSTVVVNNNDYLYIGLRNNIGGSAGFGVLTIRNVTDSNNILKSIAITVNFIP